jgi:hypothetical protein
VLTARDYITKRLMKLGELLLAPKARRPTPPLTCARPGCTEPAISRSDFCARHRPADMRDEEPRP